MNRIALIGVLVVSALGAALAAGWNLTTDRPAAMVDGSDVAEADLVADLDSVVSNEVFVASTEPALNEGRTPGTYPAGLAAQLLTSEIYDRVIADEAAVRDVVVDDSHRARAFDELLLLYGRSSIAAPVLQQEGAVEAGAPVLDGFGERQKSRLIEARAVQIALSDALVDPGQLDAAIDDGAYSCASHILVDTEEQALDVLAQLDSGIDFAQLAQAVSTDPGSPGGDLGCAPVGAYPPEFEAAILAGSAGDVVGPVATQFGFHVISVRDAEPVIAAALAWQARNELLADVFGSASIEVDTRWGTWNPETFLVDPPHGPELETFDFDA